MAVHGGSHYHHATELFSWATLDLEVMEYGAATTSKPVFKPPTMACFSFFFLTVYLISSAILFGM